LFPAVGIDPLGQVLPDPGQLQQLDALGTVQVHAHRGERAGL
jgi:hypothetical protein